MRASPKTEYVVYILLCGDGTLYTGITTDAVRRFEEHKRGVGGHYTRARGARRLVYTEKAHDRSLALRREAEIKKLPRAAKQKLIRSL